MEFPNNYGRQNHKPRSAYADDRDVYIDRVERNNTAAERVTRSGFGNSNSNSHDSRKDNSDMATTDPTVLTGTVKWFSSDKDFGFIIPDHPIENMATGSKGDVFVHGTSLRRSNIAPADFDEGVKVEFNTRELRGRFSAINLKIISKDNVDSAAA